MNILNELDALTSLQLEIMIYRAIEEAISTGQNEPSIVAELTKKIPESLKSLTKIGKYTLTTGGIFVHQTPKVKFNGMQKTSIEIGDLLLLNTIIDQRGNRSRRAMLFQAKMVDALPATPDNGDQHDLYEKWPLYTYVHGALQNQHRYITATDLHLAAKYLLLNKNNAGIPFKRHYLKQALANASALTASPTRPLNHYQCFAEELRQFILGNAGKIFLAMDDQDYKNYSDLHNIGISYPPSVKNVLPFLFGFYDWEGWSLMVNDLIRSTARKATRLMNVQPSSQATGVRGVNVENIMMFTSSISLISQLAPPSDQVPTDKNDPNEEDGGISIIEFILQEVEGTENNKYLEEI